MGEAGRSNPERVLDLLPDREREEERHEDQDAEEDEESQARAPEFALVLDTRASPRPGTGEPALDRPRVDRWVFCERAFGSRGTDGWRF